MRFVGPFIALLIALGGCAGTSQRPAPAAALSAPAPAVVLQDRRDWRFAVDGVRFDNRLPAARLSGVERLARGHYRVRIEPEIEPVNPSPWYGFRISAERPRLVRIDFDYGDYRHRYRPKLSLDGERWRDADEDEFRIDASGRASLRVALTDAPLRVFAQPPTMPEDFEAWIERLAGSLPLRRAVFGHSRQGRVLPLFEFGDDDAPLLIVLGRQHPPEHTGTQALFGFVETLAADTPLARRFRRQVTTLVAPVLNPDGIVEGHWRGNLGGQDLNRDWGPFAEPETRALAERLLAATDDDRAVAFVIDFHSTWDDVLYTVADDPARQPGGVLAAWIAAMDARFPGRIREQAAAATSPVFKNWAWCRFGAPAVTYEVGDNTPQATLDVIARHAAQALMRILVDAGGRVPSVPPQARTGCPH